MKGLLHHVEVNVEDLEESRVFWEWLLEHLGYSLFQEWENGFSYKLGGTYLVFVQTLEKYAQHGFHRCGTGLNHLAFHGESKDFIDHMHQLLLERKPHVHLLYEDRYPHAGGPDSYGVFFEDPNRIKVEITL